MNREATHRLIQEIEEELDRLARVARLVHDARERFATAIPNDFELSGVASILGSFYSGAENIFKRVGGELNGGLPRGGSWHLELLQDMALNLPELRPAVIGRETGTLLREYLDFRHLVRNLYGFDLRWGRVKELLFLFDEAYDAFTTDIARFIAFLKAMAEDADQGRPA